MSKNDGGPAFPIAPCGTGDPRDGMTTGSEGMTLRDWFASQALIAKTIAADRINEGARTYMETATSEQVAVTCYDLADAMLKAREQ